MRKLISVLGLTIAATGLGLAGWAPGVFALLSGHELPMPVSVDTTAMTIWSGVAFARAFGAVLFGLGMILWAGQSRTSPERRIGAALCVSATFGAAIVLAQQIAIWSNAIGFVLVGLFGLVALVSGFSLLMKRDAAGAAAA